MQTLLKNQLYAWSGTNAQQKNISGEIQAFSPNLAKIQLRAQGIRVISVRRILLKNFLPLKKLSAADLSFFFRQLATLIAAGIPLLQSFAILLQSQQHQPQLITLVLALKKELESGKPLAKALRAQPHYFDNLSCHLIHIAEQTGTLAETLARIAHYHEKLRALKNRLMQAMLYPAIILATAIFITIVMLMYVIPQFAELFANFHAQLPALTLFIIHLSNVLRHYYGLLLLPVLAGFICHYYYLHSLPPKKFIDFYLLRLPWLRHLISQFIFARFARTLATILAAGMPLPQALNVIIDIIPNHFLKTAIADLHRNIISGQRLYSAMGYSPWFPALLMQMVQVGEESGCLPQMLEKVAEFYEAELDVWVTNFCHLLEPLIIMILGVLIGGLVIAMYLPLFKLGTVI